MTEATKLRLTSRLILGAQPLPDTAAKLRANMGADADTQINPMVLEVEIDGQHRYCCWAGGIVPRTADGSAADWERVQLTLAGQAALEALTSLPFIKRSALVFQEVRLGKTPLAQKVAEAFVRTAPFCAVIVFVGDLANELDGKMAPAFNLSGIVAVDEILGRHQPKH
jgi:hypothetical protein